MSCTRLLVSVRNPDEARAALAGSWDWHADLIDVKDPARGPMGMADPEVIHGVVAAVAYRAPVSVSLGDLGDTRPIAPLPDDVAYVKIGVLNSGGDWPDALTRRFAQAPGCWRVPVAYAPQPGLRAVPPEAVLEWAIDHDASAILWDTAIKDGSNLLDHLDESRLAAWIKRARAHQLMTVLAGSLTGESFRRALTLNPDVIAVRSAACVGGRRDQPIDPRRVRELFNLIATHNAPSA